MRALTVPSDVDRRFVIYATKGLVDVAEAELRQIVPGVSVRERAERFLVATMTPADVERVGARARVIDDIRLAVAGPMPVRDAEELEALCTAAATEIMGTVAGADDPTPWSVTLSTRNPPWRRKPRWDPNPILARDLHDADPNSTERRPIDVRIQLDGTQAHAAVNLWERPIGKQNRDIAETWPGALRPTVAAAMVRLAIDLGGERAALYDPFCGSGTIVGEATHRGLPIFASDISQRALQLTRTRLAAAGLKDDELRHRVFFRDVHAGMDRRVNASLLVGNLPWGKQVDVPNRTALFDAVAELAAHTLRTDGAVVLLTTNEDQLTARMSRHGLKARSRPIGLLGQSPAIVTCTAQQATKHEEASS